MGYLSGGCQEGKVYFWFIMDVCAEMMLLVDAATQTGYPTASQEAYAKIKALVRSNEKGSRAAYDSLSSKMKYPDSEVESTWGVQWWPDNEVS